MDFPTPEGSVSKHNGTWASPMIANKCCGPLNLHRPLVPGFLLPEALAHQRRLYPKSWPNGCNNLCSGMSHPGSAPAIAFCPEEFLRGILTKVSVTIPKAPRSYAMMQEQLMVFCVKKNQLKVLSFLVLLKKLNPFGKIPSTHGWWKIRKI